ncbi:ABC transporter permease [Brevibacillus daliensis]|uniref:ABC transporter permease n=1 Tax=Brevibacillus daliensis TaxID=2892995 RepID=UPI0035A126C7
MDLFSMGRFLSIVKKEIIQFKRDKPSLAIALAMPIMMLMLFGYAISTDVENIKTTVWDQSRSADSRDVIASLEHTQLFEVVSYSLSEQEVEDQIDQGKADVALIIPPDFAHKRDNDEPVALQMLINGSDPNIARTATANAQLIIQHKALAVQEKILASKGMGELEQPMSLETRVLFNPDMDSNVFNIPGLIGLIMQNVTMILTAFSLVREKEKGTMEQLNVTPIKPVELFLGKITPYFFIGMFSFLVVLILGIYWFHVPVKGSMSLLVTLSGMFLITTLALGMFVSIISKTQLQAMQLAFAFILPSVLLSGFLFPRDTMPMVIQWIGAIVPLTYYLEILRGIFLKGVGVEALWQDIINLMIFFVLLLSIAVLRFRKKVE